MDNIPAWWPREPKPGNFGDLLTPYIVNKISNKNVEYVNKSFDRYNKNLLAVGSVISFANENTIVWGAGAMSKSNKPSPKADYRAVRGPITRELVISNGGKCPAIYGDPALLLPKFYKPKISKKFKYGIIPHYVDNDLIKNVNDDCTVINLLNSDIEYVIDCINECELIISSSLHGIITANAYNIDAAWVRISDKILGDSTKYYDYFKSVLKSARYSGDSASTSDSATSVYKFRFSDDSKKFIVYRVSGAEDSSKTADIKFVFNWLSRDADLVIDFQPEFKGSVLINQAINLSYDYNNNTQYGVDASGNQIVADTKLHQKASGSSSTSDSEESKTTWADATMFAYNATLTTLGIPAHIDIPSYIKVVPLIYGKAHNTQGTYMITKVTDNIDTSGYTSTFDLVKLSSVK
jgi:hypothetical protein